MNDQVLSCIYDAIDEVNLEREDKPPLAKSLDTPIHGTESGLDSLSLVNLVILIEENLEQRLEAQIMLSDDRALNTEPSPFDSVGGLAEYIETLLTEATGRPVEAPAD